MSCTLYATPEEKNMPTELFKQLLMHNVAQLIESAVAFFHVCNCAHQVLHWQEATQLRWQTRDSAHLPPFSETNALE